MASCCIVVDDRRLPFDLQVSHLSHCIVNEFRMWIFQSSCQTPIMPLCLIFVFERYAVNLSDLKVQIAVRTPRLINIGVSPYGLSLEHKIPRDTFVWPFCNIGVLCQHKRTSCRHKASNIGLDSSLPSEIYMCPPSTRPKIVFNCVAGQMLIICAVMHLQSTHKKK
jgi:hypothetical protein